MMPDRATAAGTTKTARARLLASAKAPIIGGEMASPSKWITKMLTAIAIARAPTGTLLTMTTFTGLVLRNSKNSAMKNHTMYAGAADAVRAYQVGTMPAKLEMA